MVTFSANSKKRCIFFAIGPISKILDVLKSWDTILSRSDVDLCGRFQESSAKSWKSSVETVFQYSRCGAIGKWSSFFVIGPISFFLLMFWKAEILNFQVLTWIFANGSAKGPRNSGIKCHIEDFSHNVIWVLRHDILFWFVICCVVSVIVVTHCSVFTC